MTRAPTRSTGVTPAEGAGETAADHPSAPFDTATLERLPDATVVVEPSGRIAALNGLAARLVGVDADELVGRDATESLPLSDEADRDWWASARPLEGDPRLAPRIPEADLRLAVSGRSARPVTVTAARVRDGGHSLAWLVISLRRAERRRRVDAARSDLVSTVSHEIRSPLTSVKGFTRTLLAKWERFTDEQKRQMLATVDADADRVTRLLGELLDVSRIDAGRLRLQRHMVDVGGLAQGVVDRLAVAGNEDRLAAEALEDLPQLYVDPDKLEQVVTNLVENALKYGEGTVHVSAEVGDDTVLLSVADHGTGIPEEDLSAIFTKFFSRSGERRSGTGLGLYITRGIVEAHGGRIWAESPPGKGARFTVALPRGGLELADGDRSVAGTRQPTGDESSSGTEESS